MEFPRMGYYDFVYDEDDRRKERHRVNCDCWICVYRWEYRMLWYERDNSVYRQTEHYEHQYNYAVIPSRYLPCRDISLAICEAFGVSSACNCGIPF